MYITKKKSICSTYIFQSLVRTVYKLILTPQKRFKAHKLGPNRAIKHVGDCYRMLPCLSELFPHTGLPYSGVVDRGEWPRPPFPLICRL